ncbi:MAG: alpha/beta fold hydrolase [Anaerolineales bacterium]|nr:alpha/beta fold hydrolase [Anaerolineales bacterium]
MSTNDLLQAGIEAAQKGDHATASKLFVQVVQSDPYSELGWLWLGYTRTASDQREHCFRRVLQINPNNVEAKRQMEILHQIGAVKSDEPKRLESLPLEVDSEPQIQSELRPAPRVVKPQPRKTAAKKRKGGNELRWIILAGVGILFLVCLAISGYVVFQRFGPQSSVADLPLPTATIPVITPTPNYTVSFEPSECEFVKPMQVRITCGYVRVPEDRTGNLNDTIQLAVAIYHSVSDTPKPDPILYLQGGPGQKAITWSIGAHEIVIAPLLVDRDFIVFDPRGVGYSKPNLECDEVRSVYLDDVQGNLPAAEKISYYQGAMYLCKNNFDSLGANMSAYNSVEMASDAKDVIRALGYGQANLYGISYGTRVAQFIMRAHPEVVRSAILDSVVPVETQLFATDTNAEYERLVRVLFEDCKADTACNSAFPDLENAYIQAVNNLNAQPVTVTLTIGKEKTLEQTINGFTFRSVVIWALRYPQAIAAIPHLIYRTRDGDYSQLKYAAAIPLTAFDSITLGSYIAVNCHDQVFAIPTEGLDETIYASCKIWGVKPPLPGENDPVVSALPTLIFAGQYDAVTPTTFAHQLAGHLSHAYLVEIPNQGHAPSATGLSDCPTTIITSFLQDPNLPPDQTCVGEAPDIKFIVPFDPNTPLVLEPVTVEEYGLIALVPAEWQDARFGFFNRNGSLADTTQVGIQRAAVSEAEWTAWLYSNFRGDQGFDRPAEKVGERRANGLVWTIYRTTSLGNPVDMAFAKYRGETIMVLLISHSDEHDALYNTVFMPVIDSVKPAN